MTNLTLQQIESLAIFASISDVRLACNKIGISPQTYYNWLKIPEFSKELHQLRNKLIVEVFNEIKLCAKKSAEILVQLLDENENSNIRISTTIDLINYVMKFPEKVCIKQLESSLNRLKKLLNAHEKFALIVTRQKVKAVNRL